MSSKNKTEKIKSINSKKINNGKDSESKTYLDSLYISNLYNSEKEKENINKNIQLYNPKKKNDNKKQKNFYMALKIINTSNENIDNDKNTLESFNTSNGSKNLLSRISEFSEANFDKSKDYNISKYLHHPITKQVTKIGNQLIKMKNTKAYRVNNGLEIINKPLVTTYNMKNIFEKFNNSFVEIENSNTNSKISNNDINDSENNKFESNKNIEEKKKINRNKKIKYFHKKNKSSITNYYFNENNSTGAIANCNHKKNNRYVIHYRDNISSLIGGQNRINYKDKESNTTATKDDYMKDFMQIHELNDINININIFNNNRNLEIINDFDETKEKNIYSTNKKNGINNSSNKKGIIIKNEYTNSIPKNIFSIKKGKTSTESKGKNIYSNDYDQTKNIDFSNEKEEEDNKIKTYNKFNNYSINKTLRKKYERTEFKFKYVDNTINQNNFIMKKLINKFDQCSEIKKNEKVENNEFMESKSNSTNKNNETVVIKEDDNNLVLNLDVSVGNDSFIKNYNNQEKPSNSEKNIINEISKNTVKSSLNHMYSKMKKNNYKYNYNNLNKTKDNIKIDKLLKNYSLNLNDSLNIKKRNSFPFILDDKNKTNKNYYLSPEKYKTTLNTHHFNLNSPFIKNDDSNSNISKSNIKLKTFESNNNINEYSNNETSQINQTYEMTNDQQPQSVYDYTFYQKLLIAEEKMMKNCKILSKYGSVLNTEIRLEIILWMMKTCEEFAFKRDTYHNSCHYFDMFLINNKQKLNDKNELELIGLTCIVISAKLEEIQLPRLKEYAELLSSKYNIKSIIEMEKKICSKLSWRLIIITKNIWLSWYVCQWDLFIDTIDNIKEELLNLLNEDDILYYKKPNDNSYYNFRKISQLIDIMTLDFYSYNFEPRILIAACFFVLICYNYKFKYNFVKKKLENNTPLSNLLFDLYDKFITQSFDYNFNDQNVQKAIQYCYNYINFPFIFDLPLLYQVHQSKLDGDSYEDFLSYQTTNDNYYKIMKERINVNNNIIIKKKKNLINSNKKYGTVNKQNIIFHRKTFSSNVNLNINSKK